MGGNKERLYVALYETDRDSTMPGGEDKYHWAILTGPKVEERGREGTRHHAKDGVTRMGGRHWYYAWQRISMTATQHLLVRVTVGKIVDREHLLDVLEGVPIVQEDRQWNCVVWVQHALEALQVDKRALGTAVLDWNTVRDRAMKYRHEKDAQGRLRGVGVFNRGPAPTFDLLQQRETIP